MHFVSALDDPRLSPAKPFFIGKGTAGRASDHVAARSGSKGRSEHRELVDAGATSRITIVVEDLTEAQALRLEAELIAA